MQHNKLVACTLAAIFSATLACSKNSESPTSPASTTPSSSDAYSDGSTLKANPPSPQSPKGGEQMDQLVLTANKATAKFNTATSANYSYQFAIRDGSSNTICNSPVMPGGSGDTVSWTPSSCTLDFDTAYTWRVRATFQGANSSWSADAAFRSAAGGYMRPGEMYDPLINGETIGEIRGPVTFIRGVGVRLEDFDSHIIYRLPQTISAGEFSMVVTNMATNTEGGKTKVMSMGEGEGDIVTNDRRMTIEKRGDPPGIVAWRFITHDDQIDTEGVANRLYVEFDERRAYLFTATWNGFFNLRISEPGGRGVIYDKGKSYHGRPYDPVPHVAYVGAPIGRSGPPGASVPGMIVRHVWLSTRARPASIPSQ